MRMSIQNRRMRRLSLEQQAITSTRSAGFDKQQLLETIERLGYVQIDSINAVERAHHLILFSRHPRYRPEMLRELLEEDGALFEHWTHDASIIPADAFPHWEHRFASARESLSSPRWRKRLGPKPERVLAGVRERIRTEGPLRARDFENAGGVKRGSWWSWTHEKTALELLWRCGELGIRRRDGFQKVYDRMEEVVPDRLRAPTIDRGASIDWKCRAALERLGAATVVEIAQFWSSFPTSVVREWVEAERSAGRLIDVEVETADASTPRARVAFPDLEDRLDRAAPTPRGMRLLSPFDPLIRDRKRTAWLYGFDYRIEVFVPEAKREYGYYVLPILEGDRFTGRVDLKTHRKQGALEVKGLWWERGVECTPRRQDALARCLTRLARFVGVEQVRGFPV